MTAAPRPTLLVADPDAAARAAACAALHDEFDVLEAGDRDAAWRILEDQYVQAVFCGLDDDSEEGRGFLKRLRRRWPEVIRIVLSDPGQHHDLGPVLPEIGPHQVLARPCPEDLLRMAARNAVAAFDLAREHDRLRLELRCLGSASAFKMNAQRAALDNIHGFDKVLRDPKSPMNPIVERARQCASFDVPVLLQGPAGSGKAILAEAMHEGSLRSDQPFVAMTCAGLSDEAAAQRLFGTRRSLTSATSGGLVAQAEHGTLFLNGVEHLALPAQRALVRLIEDQTYLPFGATEPRTSRLRLIVGLDRDPQAAIRAGTLDARLYFAVSVAELTLPALRDRACDIPLLATQILLDAAAHHGKPVRGLTPAALDFLQAYDWPGNLPELRNEVTRMLIFAQAPMLDADLISRHILQAAPTQDDAGLAEAMAATGPLKDRVEAMEKRVIRETLTRLKWNKSRAADELGLSRVGLRAKLDRYGLAPTPTREPQEA